MLQERLKKLRLSRGLSMEELVATMGGIVTKQAISKYERGLANPSARVLIQLAQALGVKTSSLLVEPEVHIDFIAYRKGCGLKEREQQRIKSFLTVALERWIDLQEITGSKAETKLPVQSENISKLEDVESIAYKIRQQWKLGFEPISNVTNTFENNNVFVVEVKADEKFDGISAFAKDGRKKVKAAVVASRQGIAGERQRLNLAHELGHLILNVSEKVDEEKAAFRFGAAFLAPGEIVYDEVGTKRTNISFEELLLLKKRLGLSLQAIVYRLKDLGIINQSYYKEWFIHINRQGWKKKEPGELKPEKPQWLIKTVFHALSENLITLEKAESLLGKKLDIELDVNLAQRRAFARLSLRERKSALLKQAQKVAPDYEYDSDWLDLEDIDGH